MTIRTKTGRAYRMKKSTIDLTMVGRYEMVEPAIANKDQWLAEKFPEAHIVEPYTAPEVKLPRYQAEPSNWNVWEIINLKQFLP